MEQVKLNNMHVTRRADFSRPYKMLLVKTVLSRLSVSGTRSKLVRVISSDLSATFPLRSRLGTAKLLHDTKLSVPFHLLIRFASLPD